MNYEIVNLVEKQVVGLIKETTNENGKAIKDIGEMWEKFLAKAYYEKIKNRNNKKFIAVYTDYQGDFTNPYNFLICSEVIKSDNLESPLVSRKIPGGKYAKFVIKGDVKKSVQEFWSELWQMNLDRRYSCDFEEYQNNSNDMENQEIHIYISLN
ncbi:GyrI-like domain-containing protein [Clostridium sp. ATCC 25772]|uniref:GyrI-like domain-containing protein n=1 Tax=Clostridium sp. ATCC 25772 TaxID=1676991 RepID=UPI000785BCF9|nr:GyrI-like domain-containing protein [Clostridium sp. ATCC 25772]